MNIGFLGCGTMGGAILAGLVESESFMNPITVVEKNTQRRKELASQYGLVLSGKEKDLISCEIIILAIKPQGLEELLFQPAEGTIIISLLAGIPIHTLREKFPMARIVRTMPNLGQLVGKGMTGMLFDPNSGFEAEEKKMVEKIFRVGGEVILVENEDQIDSICAISGSGPAYFFLFAQCLAQAAEDFGFTPEEAELLARQTFIGAGKIVEEISETSLNEWKQRVMSPGGTTEQAIISFESAKLEMIVQKATKAALKRAKELAGG